MGVFTDQVQGIVSEQKLQRLAKEQKEKEKAKKEELKRQLHNILSSYFTEAETIEYKNIYLDLLKNSTKWEIIEELTHNENEEYYLDTNYLLILNKIKTSYIIQYNEEQKKIKENTKILQQEEKEKAKQEQRLQKHKKNKNKIPSTIEVIIEMIKCTCFILFIPIMFLGMIFYYLIKGTGKRKK